MMSPNLSLLTACSLLFAHHWVCPKFLKIPETSQADIVVMTVVILSEQPPLTHHRVVPTAVKLKVFHKVLSQSWVRQKGNRKQGLVIQWLGSPKKLAWGWLFFSQHNMDEVRTDKTTVVKARTGRQWQR